jgi:uncharacterized phage protein (TIGR02218 family)
LKTLTPQALAHLRQRITQLTWCWKITRTDGTVMGFTKHDKDLLIDGLRYKARSGIKPTAIASDDTLSVNNQNIESILSDDGITALDLSGGKWDYAKVETFLACYTDLSIRVPLLSGVLGQTEHNGRSYSAELRTLTQNLSQTQNDVTQKNCRYEFGDSRCTKDLSALTYTLSVAAVQSRRAFTVPASFAGSDKLFNFGRLTWDSGGNLGTVCGISRYTATTKTIELFEPTASPIQPGDTFTAIAGCERTERACKAYGNDANYGGEPHVPGADEFLKGAK